MRKLLSGVLLLLASGNAFGQSAENSTPAGDAKTHVTRVGVGMGGISGDISGELQRTDYGSMEAGGPAWGYSFSVQLERMRVRDGLFFASGISLTHIRTTGGSYLPSSRDIIQSSGADLATRLTWVTIPYLIGLEKSGPKASSLRLRMSAGVSITIPASSEADLTNYRTVILYPQRSTHYLPDETRTLDTESAFLSLMWSIGVSLPVGRWQYRAEIPFQVGLTPYTISQGSFQDKSSKLHTFGLMLSAAYSLGK